jgi:hypothetical protein
MGYTLWWGGEGGALVDEKSGARFSLLCTSIKIGVSAVYDSIR